VSKKLYPILIFICGILNYSWSQEMEPITTDRPDQSEASITVPAKYFQIETGFLYERVAPGESNTLTPNILWKYGINDRFELRLITDLAGSKSSQSKFNGLSPVVIGFKSSLANEKGGWPAISFIGHLGVPALSSKDFKTSYYVPSFRFCFSNSLSDKISLSYNAGAQWDGETPNPNFIYTLTGGYGITDKLSTFIELYGYLPQEGDNDHRFDAGFTYLTSNDTQVDISVGKGLSEGSPDYFLSCGFSFRFK
jgi:hypothetical protein